jgi:hypothetical protein
MGLPLRQSFYEGDIILDHWLLIEDIAVYRVWMKIRLCFDWAIDIKIKNFGD